MHDQLPTCTLGVTDMGILAREKLIAKMENIKAKPLIVT